MSLLGLLRVHGHRRAVRCQHCGSRRAGLARLDSAEQLFETALEIVPDPTADPDDDSRGLIPRIEVRRERLACRALDRLLRPEDVPPEWLIVEQQLIVDVAHVALRSVEVDVHLLEDHTLLLLDLSRIETRVPEHVDEHVECDVARLGCALHVVAGDLLAGERVELASDRVDLRRDRARSRPPLRPLEEHVLGEVRDSLRIGGFVARSCCEHHEARDRAHLRHRRRQDADAVSESRLFEDGHDRRWYRQASCPVI